MPATPLPPELDRFLAAPRQAVVATVRPDGTPVTAGTWYEWADGRLLLSMDAAGRRIRNIRHEPRVALTVFGDSWYTHLSLLGRVVEVRADPDFVDIDRISQRYKGEPYPDHASEAVSAIAEIERWHTYGDPG
jgi:PPOX class probable F420-dependent enzyme